MAPSHRLTLLQQCRACKAMVGKPDACYMATWEWTLMWKLPATRNTSSQPSMLQPSPSFMACSIASTSCAIFELNS